jgi:hypothetical protein
LPPKLRHRCNTRGLTGAISNAEFDLLVNIPRCFAHYFFARTDSGLFGEREETMAKAAKKSKKTSKKPAKKAAKKKR